MLEPNEENMRKVTRINYNRIRRTATFCTPPEASREGHINMAALLSSKAPPDDGLLMASQRYLQILVKFLEMVAKHKFVEMASPFPHMVIFVREDRVPDFDPGCVH